MTDPEIDNLVKLQIMIEGLRAGADPAHVGLIKLYEEMLELTGEIKTDIDADPLRGVMLLVEDLLEDAEIWSVNPVKLKHLREGVEALPERLLSGPLS